MIKFEVGTKKYELTHVDFYTKGYLRDYINCMLEDIENDTQYEVLYRVTDHENGKDYALVSVDYGWELSDDETISKIEQILTGYAIENNLINMLAA